MLSDEQIHYDPVGNVSAVTTILPAGTDHQLFCYDEQNRLTWAGTTTGNPCGNTGATGSFGGASYTQSFAYDTLNRLASGPLGAYTYGDTHHLHAATSVSNGYTASYDAAGDMQCRAPSSSTTCSGTPTGQTLTWDVEGRLSNWQNATTSPTVTAKYLYDGEGNRVVQQVTDSTAGSTTTTTSYVGSLETHSITTSSGPTNITTTDYIPAGKVLAESVNGTLSYLATSYQGSIVAALDSTGAVGVTASQLYAPYGSVRYANGAMPTDYGYTGQRADASTGLDYYGARYYDPTLGQFTSADTVLDGGGLSICGLNRYAYVKDNPETLTDPSGNCPQRAKPRGWAKVAQVAIDLWAAVNALLIFRHNVGSYSGTNRNGGGGPEYRVEAKYDPSKNVASAPPPPDPCDGSSTPRTRTIYVNPNTGEITGETQAAQQEPRAVRRGSKPAPQYGSEGENGVQGAQVPGKNVTDPGRPWAAHFEAIDSANSVRGLDASPWEQHLIDLNDQGPGDPEYSYYAFNKPKVEVENPYIEFMKNPGQAFWNITHGVYQTYPSSQPVGEPSGEPNLVPDVPPEFAPFFGARNGHPF